jgi:hypothetical protein
MVFVLTAVGSVYEVLARHPEVLEILLQAKKAFPPQG